MYSNEALYNFVLDLNTDYGLDIKKIDKIINGLKDPYTGVDMTKLLIELDRARDKFPVRAQTAEKEFEVLKEVVFNPIDKKEFNNMPFKYKEYLDKAKGKQGLSFYIDQRVNDNQPISVLVDVMGETYKELGQKSKKVIAIRDTISKALTYLCIIGATLFVSQKCQDNQNDLPAEKDKPVEVIPTAAQKAKENVVLTFNQHTR